MNAFLAAAIGGRPLVLEADQEVRGEADEAPGRQQHQEVAALDEQQHREDEERHVREEAALLVDLVHVADRVADDQRADAGDDQHHEDRQLVDVDLQAEVEVAGGEPAPRGGRLRTFRLVAREHLHEAPDGSDEGAGDGRRADQPGCAAVDRAAERA